MKESRGAAKLHLVLGLSVLMMLVPAFLYLAGPLRRPLLMDGDRLEMRACPDCQGIKQDCSRCRGQGQVEHVIPGPHRPTQIIGHVYGPDQSAVPQASVSIATSVGPLDLKTDDQGRFGTTLPPGNYSLTVQAPQGQLQEPLRVEALTAPAPADKDWTFPTEHRALFLQPKK